MKLKLSNTFVLGASVSKPTLAVEVEIFFILLWTYVCVSINSNSALI